MLLAWELGFKSVILDEDTKDVFDNFGVWNNDLSQTGAIMFDAIHITSWFSFFRVRYVPRHYNVVADELAAIAKFSESNFWIGECPICIEDLVSFDFVSE